MHKDSYNGLHNGLTVYIVQWLDLITSLRLKEKRTVDLLIKGHAYIKGYKNPYIDVLYFMLLPLKIKGHVRTSVHGKRRELIDMSNMKSQGKPCKLYNGMA